MHLPTIGFHSGKLSTPTLVKRSTNPKIRRLTSKMQGLGGLRQKTCAGFFYGVPSPCNNINDIFSYPVATYRRIHDIAYSPIDDNGNRQDNVYGGVSQKRWSLLKKSIPNQAGGQNELKTPDKQAQNTTRAGFKALVWRSEIFTQLA